MHYLGLQGHEPGPDGVYGTGDDVVRTLTTPEADDALRETVGHECGHGVHVEHHFIEGDEHVFPVGYGNPGSPSIDAGGNGLCNTGAAGDDVQVIPLGQGEPGSMTITDGGDGIDPNTTITGDDYALSNVVWSGPDGIAQSTAGGNDVQVIPVGQGAPNAVCVNTGPNGISDSSAVGDDVQRVPVGNGEPFVIGITAGPNGTLDALPWGDDTIVGPPQGPAITTGPNGIVNTYSNPPRTACPAS